MRTSDMADRVERKYRDTEGKTGANSSNAPRPAQRIRDSNGPGVSHRYHLCRGWSPVDADLCDFPGVSGSFDGMFGHLRIAENDFRSDESPAL